MEWIVALQIEIYILIFAMALGCVVGVSVNAYRWVTRRKQ